MTRPALPQKQISAHGLRPKSPRTLISARLDTVLEQLQVISQAQECLHANDLTWFVQTLRTELEALGNLARFEAHLTGDGAIAQGTGAWAVGQQGTLIEPCK